MGHKGYTDTIPHKLKKLENGDIVPIPVEADASGFVLATKQEVTKIVGDFVQKEFEELKDFFIQKRITYNTIIEEKMKALEKQLIAYLDHKFNVTVENMCNKLLDRKIQEEIEQRVNDRLEEIKIKKAGKGFI